MGLCVLRKAGSRAIPDKRCPLKGDTDADAGTNRLLHSSGSHCFNPALSEAAGPQLLQLPPFFHPCRVFVLVLQWCELLLVSDSPWDCCPMSSSSLYNTGDYFPAGFFPFIHFLLDPPLCLQHLQGKMIHLSPNVIVLVLQAVPALPALPWPPLIPKRGEQAVAFSSFCLNHQDLLVWFLFDMST